MNWGKGIIIGMGLFMLFIIFMCVKMFLLPADDYDHHYYEKGLNFDKDYAKEKQVAADKAQPLIWVSGGVVNILFTEQASGTARFVRPSSEALDKTFAIHTQAEKSAILPVGSLAKGRWRIVLEWESGNKNYLYEKEVDL
ncbi:FixH family protein [Mucilaginibacter pocheonensis]|uniref:Nitrogen fixation protein FixH n=1 Tax=Mucilaginibacter pocheonensis TaxID=398050 RepID=A0ABU1TD44_9SPHI|nr:FixH family protein [Mucilaginibacter pocheonensis]MDR6942765.1 nitrogen fixation protein FixH [Mucilaginibacter pocheonensis]